MSELLDLIKGVTRDAFYDTKHFFVINARYAMKLLSLLSLLFAFFAGYSVVRDRPETIVLNLAIALVIAFMLSFAKSLVVKAGYDDDTPVPSKRFTEVDDEGMVMVPNDRLQELLLYVSDVEDYLERKGKLQ